MVQPLGQVWPVLLFASAVGVALVAMRAAWTRQWDWFALVWNLFLAWLPLVFALTAYTLHERGTRRGLKFFAAAFAWLIFFPNAPYIFTDLTHLPWARRHSGHFWVDMAIILVLAMTGLVLGFLSLYLMQSLVVRRFGRRIGWLFAAGVTGLCGLGIYLGRFLRWNSWDPLIYPHRIIRDIGERVANPEGYRLALVFSLLFALFLFLAYLMLYSLTHLKPARFFDPESHTHDE